MDETVEIKFKGCVYVIREEMLPHLVESLLEAHGEYGKELRLLQLAESVYSPVGRQFTKSRYLPLKELNEHLDIARRADESKNIR